MTDLYLLPISGQDEIGGGCYALCINDDIFLFNAGAKQPYQNNTLGIKRILPDSDWLISNKTKIKGIFIGEPSTMMVDGLLHLVTNINPYMPIYTTELGKTFIESNFNYEIYRNQLNFRFNFKIIKPLEIFYVGNHKIIPFTVFSAIPLSVGFIIKDGDGDIVFLNNFILCNDYSKLFNDSLPLLPAIVKDVKLLIVGVGNVSYSKSFTTPSFQVRDYLYNLVSQASGRIIAGIYDTDLYYLYALASVAKQTHRPLIIYSSSSINVFSNSIKLKLFANNNLLTLPLTEANNSDNAIIVIVSRINELFPLLMDIVNEEDKKITLKKDDLFLLLTNKIAGVEKLEADTIDAYTRSEILMIKLPKNTLPIKASVEDHKYLIKLLNPKHIIPINGLYRNFVDYADNMLSTGIKYDTVNFVYNGEMININKVSEVKQNIVVTEKYVGNNFYNNEIDYQILFERERMATDGFINFIVLFSIKEKEIQLVKFNLDFIGVVDKTFLNSEKYKNILKELDTKLNTYFKSLLPSEYNNKELKNSLRKIVEKYLEKQFRK